MGEPGLERRGPGSRLRLVLQAGALALLVLLFALLVQRTLAQSAGPHLISEIKAGKKPAAPGFDLPVIWRRSETWPASLQGALTDGRLSPQEVRGYPVVVNFWASWCGPCKDEAPRLVAAAKAHTGDVVFLGLDVQDFKQDALRFLERYGINYPSLRDGGDGTFEVYGLTGLPETYFLDRRGRVVHHSIGEISAEELEAGIRAARSGAPA
jgi:cytochrome c biogenesis protein CcmG/thiol:disulfide interchange protein DsbE